MGKKCGFTLIELLVVVLIIGILSSFALPQYRVAVEKARVAKALPLFRSIVNGMEVYKMANGSYSADVDELDISFPYTKKTESSFATVGDHGMRYEGTPVGTFGVSEVYKAVWWGSGRGYVIDFFGERGRDRCYSTPSGNTVGERVCRSLGPKIDGGRYYLINY